MSEVWVDRVLQANEAVRSRRQEELGHARHVTQLAHQGHLLLLPPIAAVSAGLYLLTSKKSGLRAASRGALRVGVGVGMAEAIYLWSGASVASASSGAAAAWLAVLYPAPLALLLGALSAAAALGAASAASWDVARRVANSGPARVPLTEERAKSEPRPKAPAPTRRAA